MSWTIFVGGVHGAGKTTVSRELAKLLGASHVTAGGLIRENASVTYSVTVGVKAVPNVDANQRLLLRGLALYRARVSGPMLLDGHFVLLDPAGGIAQIPVGVYRAISPVGVVLVETDPVKVHARLVERDGDAPPVATIAKLAQRERAHAERVCADLKIPLWTLAGEGALDDDAATSRIQSFLGGAV